MSVEDCLQLEGRRRFALAGLSWGAVGLGSPAGDLEFHMVCVMATGPRRRPSNAAVVINFA
jgi:hypothetical protein